MTLKRLGLQLCLAAVAIGLFQFAHGAPPRSAWQRGARRLPACAHAAARGSSHQRSRRPTVIVFDDLMLPEELGDHFSPEALPESISKLLGQPVTIKGFMQPSFQETMSEFVLMRSYPEEDEPFRWRYGVYVSMRNSTSIEFMLNPIAVTGILGIREFSPGGGSSATVFEVRNAEVTSPATRR